MYKSYTMVADPIIAHLKPFFKMFSWYKSISCWNFVCSIDLMLAMKPDLQNVQICSVCEKLLHTIDWYNLILQFSVYPIIVLFIAHLLAQETLFIRLHAQMDIVIAHLELKITTSLTMRENSVQQ